MKEFQILSKLGDGAFSSVWKVKRISDGQEYAMKKVKLSSLSEKEKLNALNEVRILASIQNPCIVGYKEAFFEDEPLTLCIVMEYAGGGDIFNKITQHQKANTLFKEQDIWRFAIQMISGLKTLHDMRILHRDLKCANIFLSTDGKTAKLGDLNVSKVAKNDLVYTQTGTPYYASPEVWRDEPYDMKSDMWSLGCVIYEMCTLNPPFRANDMKGLFKKVQRGIFDRIPPCYSIDLYNLISMCLQVKPSLRPTCDQLLSHPVLQRNGGSLIQQITDVDESNELLGTIRLPANIKAVIHQLPKANYSQSSKSIELEQGRAAPQKVELKRPISQNAPSAKKGYVRESQSRESRISHMQKIEAPNSKESEKEYLHRMQNEYINKAKAMRPSEAPKIQKSPKAGDDFALQRSPKARIMSGRRVPDSGRSRQDVGLGEANPIPKAELVKNGDHGNDLRHKVEDRRRVVAEPSQKNSDPIISQIRQRLNSRDKMRGEAAPERNLVQKQEYLINKYQSRDLKQEEKASLPRIYNGRDNGVIRKADYLLEKYHAAEGIKKSGDLLLQQSQKKEPVDVVQKYKHMLHMKNLPAKPVSYDSAKPISSRKVEYQHSSPNNAYTPRKAQAVRTENSHGINASRIQVQQKLALKSNW